LRPPQTREFVTLIYDILLDQEKNDKDGSLFAGSRSIHHLWCTSYL